MDLIKKNKKYKWEFENIGGTSRVRIFKGDDIAHLDELDTKMWKLTKSLLLTWITIPTGRSV